MTDQQASGRRTKVTRLICEYDLNGLGAELERHWTAEGDQRMSLRELATQFNERLLERAMAEAGLQPLSEEIENTYRLLTAEDVSSGDRNRTERRLERDGLDPEQLREQFVSYQAVHTYPKHDLRAEYAGDDRDWAAVEAEALQRFRGRFLTVGEQKLDALRSGGELILGEFRPLVDVNVYLKAVAASTTWRRYSTAAAVTVWPTTGSNSQLLLPRCDNRGMELGKTKYATGELHARNVGGIGETSVTFSPGVTILVGRNATNRTSFLQAVIAALGSDDVAIKGDAEEAEVKLVLGDEWYTRRLRRTDAGVVADGEPFLQDATVADLFAFLLESNEARRAVATGQDLRDLIMRPVDTERIRAEIDRLVEEREALEADLEEIESLKGDLPALEEQRADLRERIDEKQAALEETEAELEATDRSLEESREEQSELETKLAELREKRSALDNVRYDIDTERGSLESLKRERRELEAEGEELPEAPAGDLEEIETEVNRLRQRKQQLEAEINELQSVIGFNEELLDDAGTSTVAELVESGEGNVTDQLVADDEVTCWTCGSTVDREQIESTLAGIRELSQSKVSEANAIDEDINDRRAEKREIERARRERDRINDRLADIDREIEETKAAIEKLQSRRDKLTDAVERIEAEVEALESEDHSELLNIHKEANQLEYELGRLETDLEDVEADIAEIEARLDDQDDIEARIEWINDELEERRTRIDRIEASAVEEFNEHMDTVLEMLEYANLERIWLERVERETREGRRKVTQRAFELHIIRTSDSGTVYEDTIDHLSESEREVTGLVFALAGYLAHEVYEELPFMLLDSLEAIDAERIAALVEYLTDYTGYLLVALLPEDAAELPDTYDRITEI